MRGQLERSILQFGLMLACFYQAYQLANSIVAQSTSLGVNIGLSFLFLLLLFLNHKYSGSYKWIALFLHVIILPALIYFWSAFGGLAGTVPIILFVYISWVILTLSGFAKALVLFLYGCTFFLLTLFPDVTGIDVYNHTVVNTKQLPVDFFVEALIIIAFLTYLKNKYSGYRKRVEHRNVQLKSINNTLLKQNDSMLYSQEETQSINENLEQLIDKRIQKIEEKSYQLEEYAFINAHILRGPVCRILGLVSLMKNEQPRLEQIKEKADEVDELIRKINSITS
ncbi:MAG: hypothetical protein KF687_02825 [Cyclobacteriaceae bacterium]|nr:hypothetical protein [Cyclobacteriaceae bacterium]